MNRPHQIQIYHQTNTLSATTSALADHHSILPAVGPTPADPAPSNFQFPAKGDGGTFAKLNVHQTPAAVSKSNC